jgi:DNA-binding XRE family transcriptional regulator
LAWHLAFGICGATLSLLQVPYGNEPLGVAFLSSTTLGDRIRARRPELKLTVKECAQKLKVDVKTLLGWEKQRHQPARGMQKQLMDFLDP